MWVFSRTPAGLPNLLTQAAEEWFGDLELAEGPLTPAPIGADGSWQVLDAMSSAQATVLCMFFTFCQANDASPFFPGLHRGRFLIPH